MALQKLTGDINRDLQSQIDYFSWVNQPYVSDAFRSIKNERDWLFGSFRNDLLDQYDAFQNSINPSFNQFLQTSSNIADQLLPQINQQWQLIQQKFWPEWEFVWQANAYYKNLANAVNNAISGNISWAQNQAVRSGASQTAINQALQQARSAWLNDIAKIQAEKLAQQQSMLTNFLQLQDALRKQKFDYQNELIRNPLLALNERVSQIGQSLLGWLQGISNAEMQQLLLDRARSQAGGWGGWWGWGGWGLMTDFNRQVDINSSLSAPTDIKSNIEIPVDWVWYPWYADWKWNVYLINNWKLLPVK